MRATTDELKNERRESILAAAGRLFESEEYEAISVARIAAEAAVAKGTVFVYFSSKEAIFLELALRAFEEWFDVLKRSLFGLPAGAMAAGAEASTASGGAAGGAAEAATIARAIVDTLALRRVMLRLASLSHAILERNVALDDSLAFKRQVLDSLARLGTELQPLLPSIPAEQMPGFLLGLYSIIIGAAAVRDLPAAVRQVLMKEDAYRGIDALLDGLLADTLTRYIRGSAADDRS